MNDNDHPADPIIAEAVEAMLSAGVEHGAVPHCLISSGLDLLDDSLCRKHRIADLERVRDIVITRIEQAKADAPREKH